MRFLIFIFCLSRIAQAESAPPYTQPRLPLLSVITEIPTTSWRSLEYSFSKDSVPTWATIVGTTAILYHYDDDLYSGLKADGRRWGLGNEDHTKTVIQGFGFDLLRLPSDTGSMLYFLGDGWTHFTIAGAFFANGWIHGNNRPYNTGLQIVHGMITSTLFSQALKRATGRESPNNASEPKGRWRPFPSVSAYQEHTARYDAFPSGHIMTATLTFTVINENYPEFFNSVFPIEVVWLSALGFQMVNNGVHWASDYPLGIGMGYAIGKMATQMGLRKTDQATTAETGKMWTFFPSPGPYGPEINALYKF